MITLAEILVINHDFKRQARKEINRQRYWRQYARRTPIERKVRLGIGPVVYNCPVPRWTRKQFLSMWQGVSYDLSAQRRMRR